MSFHVCITNVWPDDIRILLTAMKTQYLQDQNNGQHIYDFFFKEGNCNNIFQQIKIYFNIKIFFLHKSVGLEVHKFSDLPNASPQKLKNWFSWII